MEALTIGALLRQPAFREVRPLTGAAGMDRTVSWFYLAGADRAPEGVGAGELLLLPWPSAVPEEAAACAVRRRAAGVLLLDTGAGTDFPPAALRRAEQAGVPVLLLPGGGAASGDLIRELTLCIARGAPEQDRLRDVMIALISGKSADPAEIRQKTLRSGYSFEVSHQALCLNFRAGQESLGDRGIRRAVEEACRACLRQRYPAYPSVFTNGKLLALLPELPGAPEALEMGETLLAVLRQRFPRAVFYIGIGKRYRKLEGFSDSIYESELAARALRSLGRDNQAGGVWELEPFALLLAIRDKKQLYALQDPVLDCLIRSDAELNLDLIQTLETYLDCGRNGKLAAGKLFIHRNTLKMRLDRIEALTGQDLSNPDHCFRLRFALYVRRFMAHG